MSPSCPPITPYAGRLVTEHGLRLGIEPHARLLADATRFQLAARVLRRHRGPITHLTSPLSMLAGDLVALDGELSEHLVEPAGLIAWDERWCAAVEQACGEFDSQPRSKGHCDDLRVMATASRRRAELTSLVQAYRAAKGDLDALDFGDQVALAAQLAETVPEVGAAERALVRVVLLDEYQDTSVAQRRMLAGLFSGSPGAGGSAGFPVTAVGDPCQAIYGWRGASGVEPRRVPSALSERRWLSGAEVLPRGQPALRWPVAPAGQHRRRLPAQAAHGRRAAGPPGQGRPG